MGMEISKLDDGSIFIHQQTNIARMIKKFDMENTKTLAVLVDYLTVWITAPAREHKISCGETFGSMMFDLVVSRPGVAFSVNLVSRYIETHSKLCWNAVKRFAEEQYFGNVDNRMCVLIPFRNPVDQLQENSCFV